MVRRRIPKCFRDRASSVRPFVLAIAEIYLIQDPANLILNNVLFAAPYDGVLSATSRTQYSWLSVKML